VAVSRQFDQRLARVRFGRPSRNQIATLETGEQAAQITAVESKRAAERRRRLRASARQFVQHAHLRQRERAASQALVQSADKPRVEAIEMADCLGPSQRLGIGQMLISRSFYGFAYHYIGTRLP
jgi:hypothetical protein